MILPASPVTVDADIDIQGGGACLFVTSLAGWWILVALMLAVVDFPLSLPVGDLSSVIKGGSEKSRV